MRRTGLISVLALGILALTSCGSPASSGAQDESMSSVAPAESPEAGGESRTLADFRTEVPQLEGVDLAQVEGLTVTQNDRLWTLASNRGAETTQAVRDAVEQRFGEFPAAARTSEGDRTTDVKTVLVDSSPVTLTLVDRGGEGFTLSVLAGPRVTATPAS
ncbi:hypothetical protein NS220_10925 [Microbacterium testaceum]|uniref:Lipoprotein n=1 Tax=Microbacterium testaceum TaxID=2033 RepID=A0A147EWU1_MICTE|nr:hypothetical protein [Microbacterium testaceum]KTR93913.1 hypothetical protein NS220_10925 [Microbacterium testaceum]